MGWLADLIKEYPALEVVRERLALEETKRVGIEAENTRLKDENTWLTAELAAARLLIPTDNFVEARGVLFKRNPAGGVEPDAYCPECKRALSAPENFLPLTCSKCGFAAPFRRRDRAGIVNGLNAAETTPSL